jgi:hypothetical protein
MASTSPWRQTASFAPDYRLIQGNAVKACPA